MAKRKTDNLMTQKQFAQWVKNGQKTTKKSKDKKKHKLNYLSSVKRG